MKAFQTLWPRSLARITASLAALTLLAHLTACGGSGGPAGTSNGTNQSGGSTTTALEVGPVTLAGVAAVGSPLLGATVSVVDAKGVLQGSTTTNTSDGSYALSLPATNIPLPLLIEANGVDMTGTPVSLHSVVQTATSGATRITVHINPATDAVVAMLLGADPTSQFQSASTQASNWTQLGNTTALSSASNLIKTIIKTNIKDAKGADGKPVDSTKLDFFQDASFKANKVGLDAVLEGLNIQIGQDAALVPQLELSNRFIAPGTPEVTINLVNANAQLALGGSGKVSDAITSTKTNSTNTTTSVTTLIANIGTLDNLAANINDAISKQYTDVMIAGMPIYSSSYVMHNGANLFDVATQLATYGTARYQLSRLQFTGCADDPMPAKGCAKPIVSALVSDATGKVYGVFNNVVSYSASTGWTLLGNGREADWSIAGTAWASWDAFGQALASGQGVQFTVKAGASAVLTSLQLPSKYSVSLYDCQMTYWCQTRMPSGELIDDYLLQYPSLGWFGKQEDAARGALYTLSAQPISGDSNLSTMALPNDVPTNTSSKVYPLPDGLSTTSSLTCAQVLAGLHVTWNGWAAANPSLRMQSVRSVVTGSGALVPWVQQATVYPLSANVTDVPAVTSPPAPPSSCQLWMVAQDKLGRHYISKIVAAP